MFMDSQYRVESTELKEVYNEGKISVSFVMQYIFFDIV